MIIYKGPVLMNIGKTEYAYNEIKRKICEGELSPLQDIVEEGLQRELRISRTPIREALQRLHKEGFVYIYPRKGTIVTEVTRDLIYDIFLARQLNEPFCTVLAGSIISREWLKEKRRAFKEPPADISGDNLRQYYIKHDRELHTRIIESCGNRFVANLLSIVHDHNHRIRMKTSNPANENYDHSVEEHTAIIDALLTGKEKEIEAAVLGHIQNSRDISLKYY
ncbi:GntR family transcriptional regulator [Marispirochaeta aestuarii]|nr:GntR family transcriptional regulator [Marispirochaeta aestuarii]